MSAFHTVHVIGSRGSGGAERFFMRLVRALKAHGDRIEVICRPGSAVEQQLAGEVPANLVAMRANWAWFSRARIARLIAEKRPQIVQTYMGRATRLTHPRKPGPVHIARLGGFYKLAGYRHADAWIGNTRAICAYLRENGFPAERVHYIPNFIEPPPALAAGSRLEWRRRLGVPPDAVVILGLGRFVLKKGFDRLIEAFALLPARIDARPLHLVLLGDGPLAGSLRAEAATSRAAGRIHFAGWQDEPAPFYGAADLFVCPSRHEPLGNVILEAWGHGLPVVSTDTHGARELITDGANGRLVSAGAAATLGEAIEALVRDEGLQRRLGEAGRSKVIAEFSPDSVLNQYLDLYARLIAANVRREPHR